MASSIEPPAAYDAPAAAPGSNIAVRLGQLGCAVAVPFRRPEPLRRRSPIPERLHELFEPARLRGEALGGAVQLLHGVEVLQRHAADVLDRLQHLLSRRALL